MKRLIPSILCVFAAAAFSTAADQKGEKPGFKDTPLLPSGWHVHDSDRPQPPVVTPAKKPGGAPSDAVILFDGSSFDEWVGTKQDDPEKKRYNPDGEVLWKLVDGAMECTPTGSIYTKKHFGDCQLHVEWRTENPPKGDSQGRGNSGVFFIGKYELQVLDNYNNPSYADGMAGAVYGQTPPMVNALYPPGEWQTYDVVFQAPRFDENGKVKSPAYYTVFVNGILVQHKTEALGPMQYRKVATYWDKDSKGPIGLQDHDNRNQFRNIWIRELDLLKSLDKPAE